MKKRNFFQGALGVCMALLGTPPAWSAEVTFSVLGEVVTTQQTDNKGHVAGYTPTATCENKHFVGWMETNQTAPLAYPPQGLITDPTKESFSNSATLYAIYAAVFDIDSLPKTRSDAVSGWNYNAEDDVWVGKVTSYRLNNATISSNVISLWTGSSVTPPTEFTTTTPINNLESITLTYTKSEQKIFVSISTDGNTWSEVYNNQLPSSTLVTISFPAVGNYYVKVGVAPTKAKSLVNLDISSISFMTTTYVYTYADYSTTCEVSTIQVDEWYSNKILFHTSYPIEEFSVLTIDNESQEDNITTFTRRASTAGYNLYELGGANFDLAAAAGKMLRINIKAPDDQLRLSASTIPAIITTCYNASTLPDHTDVVVRDGGVLTIDANKVLGDVTIYPTSRVSVPEGKNLTVNSLTLFGGIDEVTGVENRYGVPQLSLQGTLTAATPNILYRMRVNGEQMYPVSFPYDVAVSDVTRADALGNAAWAKIGRDGGTIILETYDGASRAMGHQRDTQDASTWSDITSGTLTAGIGYAVAAQPRFKNYPYVILDFPMSADFSTPVTEDVKSAPVTAHTAVNKYDEGWNLMANPYMTTLTGAQAITINGTDYDFVYIPTDDGEDFYQGPLSDTELLPFKHFFLQVAESGTMNFALANRQLAPRRMLAEGGSATKFSLCLTGNGQADKVYFKVDDTFTPEYDIPGDQAKMLGSAAATKVYVMMDNEQDVLAQVAVPTDKVQESLRLGYLAPTSGTYTLALDSTYADYNGVDHLFLMDKGVRVADLMHDNYVFATEAGTFHDRFAAQVIMRGDAPTSISNRVRGASRCRKIMSDEQVYFYVNDKKYDVLGMER